MQTRFILSTRKGSLRVGLICVAISALGLAGCDDESFDVNLRSAQIPCFRSRSNICCHQ
jgi:hypothetical protein